MIHQFSCNGYHITLDVYSNAIHVTDDVSAEAIRLYETGDREEVRRELLARFQCRPGVTAEEIDQTLAQIDEMRGDGVLYADDVFTCNACQFTKKSGVVKALCLHVAHTCNLTCSYCFAAQGKFHGDRALMRYEVGKRALDFLIENSGTRKHLEVDFFGGEPLMNWDVVKRLVHYGRELEQKTGKVFRFTLTTNGMLVDDEVIDFCNREMQNVVLSLDGRRKVHDRFRVDGAGRGSYDRVAPKFIRFAQKRGDKNYYMRGTFTRHNLDFVKDVIHMADLGFTELSMEPVVAAEGDPAAIRREDLPAVFEQYELLAAEMLRRHKAGKPITFYHYILDLEHGPCVYKRISGCGSGTEYMAVTPWGELFPCHQFVGDKEMSLGDIWQGVKNTELQEQFRANNVFNHPECAGCWAKMYCAGGCAANNLHASGRLNGIYEMGCEIFKKRIECALMLAVAIRDFEEEKAQNE